MGKIRNANVVKEEFYKLLQENGYKVEEDSYVNAHSKIKCSDDEGYLYEIKQNVFIYSKTSSKWRSNKYAKDNFKLFIDKNYGFLTLLEDYVNNSTKIKAIDNDGYLYSLSPNKLINCGRKPSRWHYNDYSTENVINWLKINQPTQKLKDGQKYKTMKTKMKFICSEHGEYEQSFFVKKYENCSCRKCSVESFRNNGFYIEKIADRKREEWELIPAIVYFIKLHDDAEEFYKVGITREDNYEQRMKSFPYDVDVITLNKMSLYDSIFIEKYIHEKLERNSYIPFKKFDGYTECFKSLDYKKE